MVSILTITELSNFDSLKILLNCLKSQTYKNIKEWIIIENSKSLEEAMFHQILVNQFINSNSVNFEIRYIPYQATLNYQQLKYNAILNASGDYLIWINVNDYLMTGLIEYLVNLSNSDNVNEILKTKIQINKNTKLSKL